MSKPTLRKVNTVAGRKFDNSYLMVDGNAVGVVGRPYIGAEHFVFISRHPDYKHLEQHFPKNKDTFKELAS